MTPGRPKSIALLGAVLASGFLLSGCLGYASDPSPGELRLSATWLDSQHMRVTATNVGESSLPLSGMNNMQLTGPNGTMPLHWNGMAPTLAPGESRVFELHAMHMEDGTMGMTMDHTMAGSHMPMPLGAYTLRLSGESAVATLES